MRVALFLVTVTDLAQEVVIRTTVPLVAVPVTVTTPQGKNVEGLSAIDFVLFDNQQRVRHSLDVTTQPIALVVAVQNSTSAGPALAKIQKIGSMFEPLVVGSRGVVAVLAYSDKITLWQDFTGDGGVISARLRKLEPGWSEKTARMHDAVLQAVDLLKGKANYRKVILILGENKDRGSESELTTALTAAQAVNVTVYSANYSVLATSFTSRGAEQFSGSGRSVFDDKAGMNLLAVFQEIGRLGDRNGGEALAQFTGGLQVSFTKYAGLEKMITRIGEDLHSQYVLSFQPEYRGPDRSYHNLRVWVNQSGVRVRARPGYWRE